MAIAITNHNGHITHKSYWDLNSYSKKWLIIFAKIMACAGATFFLAGIFFFTYLFTVLPSPTSQAMLSAPESTRLLDRNGKLLYEVHGEIRRTFIPLSEIPINLQNATLAMEDKDFYGHYGFDLSSIVRALKANIDNGEIKQGASTITQQLARISFLNNEQTYSRKLKELVLAVKIEYVCTKNEILEMYLNNIPYGSNAYGVEAASEMYFGKQARDLNLLQSAYLASLPKAPTLYSPYGPNIEALHKRARSAIESMLQLGMITEKEANIALSQNNLEFKRIPTSIQAPHFVFYVLDGLNEKYGETKVRQGGMIVRTSLDMDLQKKAERIVSEQGLINEKKYKAGNAALVALDPRNGEILAMVGSRDYFKPGDGAFNVAISPRQPGSSFKPYVYAAAMENGMNPATMLLDVQTNFANDNGGVKYVPHNYSGRNYGPVSIRQALAGSLNIPAVKTLILVGINKAIDTAEKLGLTTLKDRSRFGPALVLGGAEVKLLEHTAGLGALGNNGVKQALSPILKITDTKDNVIYENKASMGVQAIDPQAAFLINDILSDTQSRKFIFGNNKNLMINDHQVAVKTGTTQDFRDAWTIGYTPSLAVGVWVGNNDNSPMRKGADGSVVAAPIWNKFINEIIAKQKAEKFMRPEGIVELRVDRLTGKLPTKNTPSTKIELFASFNKPTGRDNAHVSVKASGLDISATALRSEKPNDPLWESAARRWAQNAGYLTADEIKAYMSTDEKKSINVPIIFSVPKTVNNDPWQISIETALNQKIESTEVFLDDTLLARDPAKIIYFNDNKNIADGIHNLSARIKTTAGDIYTVNRTMEFSGDTKLEISTSSDVSYNFTR